MTTGIPHGPLSSADLPKLTGLSVLLHGGQAKDFACRWTSVRGSPGVVFVGGRTALARLCTYLGERPEPGSPVILAPEGGWSENPFGDDRKVRAWAANGLGPKNGQVLCAGCIVWHRVGKIELIEDAKPETKSEPSVSAEVEGEASFDLSSDRPAQALSDLAGVDAVKRAAFTLEDAATYLDTLYAKYGIPATERALDPAKVRSIAFALSATPASPPAETGEGEPFAWFQMWNDGTRYPGDPKLWPPSKRDREYVEQMGRTIVPLYTHPASDQSDTERMRAAFDRQTENMAFILNHATLPEQWYEKFSRELEEDRAALAEKEAGQ